jgi:5'-3' exonuclease
MLMLLDSAGMYFRAFFGARNRRRSYPASAVRGFLGMCAGLVEQRRPTDLVACWDDDWRPAWRVDLVPEYKAHRARPDGTEEAPAELEPQVGIIAELLDAMGVCRVGVPGYEADDVIATLARRGAQAGQPVEVVTGDRDLLQLVDDARGITVLYTVTGVLTPRVMDEAAVLDAQGVAPAQYADYALLRGDPSDGLRGIAGVGTKTAAALLAQFGTVDALVAAAAQGHPAIRPRIAAALGEADDYLRRAQQVVRAAEVPLGPCRTELPAEPADPLALRELSTRLGLTAQVDQLWQAIAGVRRSRGG